VHAGVAALAGSAAAAFTPPTMVSVATTPSTVLLIDISNSFRVLLDQWVDDATKGDGDAERSRP
jgi:hypothetical protein